MRGTKNMTNHEYLLKMDENDFADWLCRQIWDDYGRGTGLDVFRFHSVRNYLLEEHEEE